MAVVPSIAVVCMVGCGNQGRGQPSVYVSPDCGLSFSTGCEGVSMVEAGCNPYVCQSFPDGCLSADASAVCTCLLDRYANQCTALCQYEAEAGTFMVECTNE